MRKIAFIFMLLLFCLKVNAFVSFWENDFLQAVTMQAICDNKAMFSGESQKDTAVFSLAAIYEIASKELQVSLGARKAKCVMDFTGTAIYAPTFFNCLNLGINTAYHVRDWDNIFCEQDLLLGLYTGFKAGCFSSTTDINYMFKYTRIYSVSSSIGGIKNHSLAIRTSCNWNIKNRAKIFLGLASYSQFNYLLFFCPELSLGGSVRVFGNFEIGTNLKVQYTDFFLLSAYLSGYQAMFFVKWTLK